MAEKKKFETNIVLDSQDILLSISGTNNENIHIIENYFQSPVYLVGNQITFRTSSKDMNRKFESLMHALIGFAKTMSYIKPDYLYALFSKIEQDDGSGGENGGSDNSSGIDNSSGNNSNNDNSSSNNDNKSKNKEGGTLVQEKTKASAFKKIDWKEIPVIEISAQEEGNGKVGNKKKIMSIVPRSRGQEEAVHSLQNFELSFLVGPAGTGKTLLTTAYALSLILSKKIQHYIITRPVVEAGEHLGYLPGDLFQKILPYMRPIFDELHGLSGPAFIEALQEKGQIEIAPLAYMRGRTLKNCLVLLDEAQNTTVSQMRMFLTRLGEGAKAVVTGDLTQSDLSRANGLQEACKIFQHVKEANIVQLKESDVQRSRIAKIVIDAYNKYDQKNSANEKTSYS